MAYRKIKRINKSVPTIEGAGVHLKRVFGFGNTDETDPFLLLDDFRSDTPEYYLKGFPWHPHRGIETITYMLQGGVEHGDSLGNSGVIPAGAVQWMTAGSGIIHNEMPKGDDQGNMEGFQLWANLPSANKMIDPRYQEFKAEEMPVITLDNGVTIKIICGHYMDQKGPVENVVINPDFMDITVPPDTVYIHKVREGYTVFAYVFDGKARFDKESGPYSFEEKGAGYLDFKDKESLIGNNKLVLYESQGDELIISTREQGVRFLFISGKPLGEPVAWYGPIVMNTREELKQAFEEFQNGTFIKKK
jgi:quercetin 2,3-dioxygenase